MDFDDYPDEEWVDEEESDEDDLLACPSCGEAVHEDTQQCPYCGDWIIPVDPRDRSRRFIWAIAAVFVILALVLIVIR